MEQGKKSYEVPKTATCRASEMIRARRDAEAQMMIHDFGDDSNPHRILGHNGLLVTQRRPAKSERVEDENEGKY